MPELTTGLTPAPESATMAACGGRLLAAGACGPRHARTIEATTCELHRNPGRTRPIGHDDRFGGVGARTSRAWSNRAARRSPPISSRARQAASNPTHAEFVDMVKTLGQVAEYWLADPQRTFELQSALGKGYLDLWAHAARRMAGEDRRAGRRAGPARQALHRSRMVVEPVLRLPEAGLSADAD